MEDIKLKLDVNIPDGTYVGRVVDKEVRFFDTKGLYSIGLDDIIYERMGKPKIVKITVKNSEIEMKKL